jgi:hypothetical protein
MNRKEQNDHVRNELRKQASLNNDRNARRARRRDWQDDREDEEIAVADPRSQKSILDSFFD